MAKDNKTMGWVILIAVVVIGYFLIAGNPFAPADDEGMVPPPVGVTCNKDYTASVTLMSRNAFEKASLVNTADTVTYRVWQLVGNMQIPQADVAEGASLEIGYNQEYLVVAMTNASLGEADVRFQSRTFEVDAECNSPRGDIFYLESLPTDIDAIFEHARITGPNAADNRINVNQEGIVNVRAIFNGQSRTVTETIIVFDVDRAIIERVESSLPKADVPQAHTAGAGERSFAFELGKFEGATDVNANFELLAHRTAALGDYDVAYTIYQYQTGYENTRTGDWVSTKSVENNDDDLLLPSMEGEIFIEIVA